MAASRRTPTVGAVKGYHFRRAGVLVGQPALSEGMWAPVCVSTGEHSAGAEFIEAIFCVPVPSAPATRLASYGAGRQAGSCH